MIKVSDKNSTARREPGRYLCFFILPLSFIYLELCLQFTGTVMSGLHNMPGIALTVGGLGLLEEGLCLLVPGKKGRFWLRFVFLEALTVWFLVMYFCDNSYRVFMDLGSITAGAGDVVTEFGGVLVTIVTSGLPLIIIYHLPVILYCVFSRKLNRNGDAKPVLTALVFLFGAAGIASGIMLLCSDGTNKAKLTTQYNYDTSVRNFGAVISLASDLRYIAFGNPYEASVDITETEPQPLAAKGSSFERHTMDVDFDSLISGTSNSTLQNVYTYLSTVAPAVENRYTGMFEGKNLIIFAAEGFAREAIRPDLTPTLYRLANKGIVFEDYYQPAWGGSTSTGEFSILTGIIPTDKVNSMHDIVGHNMYFTMGNQLNRLGYNSFGFHNGEYTYYDRHITHKWLGYPNWMGMGNGMEKGVARSWPESDLEMMQYTLPMYVDKQPFSVYYMTISGHTNYTTSGNNMSSKNWDAVADMEGSHMVKAYLACQLELEYALEYTLQYLEDAGILDDTVIVLSADHYPYGLEKSVAWESDRDNLGELYGYPADSNPARDHNALIIWNRTLEDSDPIVVSSPTYSLDIVPTLSNLFGLEYDSRFMVGRDALSDTMSLVLWSDYSWMTDKGYYDSVKNVFTPREGVTVSEGYVDSIKAIVKNKFTYSKAVLAYDLFEYVFG